MRDQNATGGPPLGEAVEPDVTAIEAPATIRADGAAAEEKAPRRRLRWLWISLGILLVSVLAVAIFGPYVIGAIASRELASAGARSGFDVTVGTCDFGWSDGLRVENLSARERRPVGSKDGVTVVVPLIEARPDWGVLAGGRIGLANVLIDRPVITIDPARRARPRPGNVPAPPPSAPPASAPPPSPASLPRPRPLADRLRALGETLGGIEARLEVRQGAVHVKSPGRSPALSLEGLTVDCTLAGAAQTLTATIGGAFVSAGRREPLRIDGGLTFGERPDGAFTCALGGVDLGALGPWLSFGDGLRVTEGIARLDGKLTAQEGVLGLVGDARIDNVRVDTVPADSARAGPTGSSDVKSWRAPAVRLALDARLDPTDAAPAAESGGDVAARRLRIEIRSLALRGGPFDIDVAGRGEVGDRTLFDGHATVRGDLRDLTPFLAGRMELAGRLDGKIDLETDGKATAIDGNLRIEKLHVKSAAVERPFDTPEAKITVAARVEGKTVHLAGLTVRGGPIDVDAKGVGRFTDSPQFDGQVTMNGDLASLTPFLDGRADLAGMVASDLTVTASAASLQIAGTTAVRDVVVGWSAATERGAKQNANGQPKKNAGAAAKVEENATGFVFCEPDGKIVANVDYRFDKGFTGAVRADGQTLGMNVELTSDKLPITRIKGTVNGDTAGLVRQMGVALPFDLVAGGKLQAAYDGTLFASDDDVFAGRFSMSGAQIRRPGIVVDNVNLEGTWGRRLMRDATLTANVNGGTIVIKGGVDLSRPDSPFTAVLDAKRIRVTQGLASFIRFVVPIYSIPEGVDAEVDGVLFGELTISGPWPTSIEMADGLVGRGSVTVDEGRVSGSPMVTEVLTKLGKKGAYSFKTLSTTFHIADATVFHDSFKAEDRELAWGFDGKTRFNTVIDYRLKPGPLIDKLYRRKIKKGKMKKRDEILRDLMKSLSTLPVGVGGTLDAPRLTLQEVEVSDIAKPLGELLEDLFGRRKKKKKNKQP